MELTVNKSNTYRIVEENKIETPNSIVYQGQDLELNRTVCIKAIDFNGLAHTEINNTYTRAMLEVRSLVALSEITAHVPSIYDVFYDNKTRQFYIIMQWIHGETLEKKMPRIPPLAFLGYIERICTILEKLEYLKMPHKDIKPSNIMITKEQEVYLIDFNLSISAPNQIEGTQNYKAPEMDSNSKYASRDKVDIFALGVIMFEYFTKKLPVRGVDYGMKSRRIKGNSPEWDFFTTPSELNPELDHTVNDIIVKCMQYNPRQRYRNSSELKRALSAAERVIKNGNRRKEN